MVVGVVLGVGDDFVALSIHGNIIDHIGDCVGHLGVGHLGEAGGGGDRVP